ncbi:MAG TPA: DNA-3-methyladenine glycosylase [Mycobacteriales bacterium]|nr:DNA-3-methyladenine glycosylase [Mycobacteriales bacterium]
MTARGSGRLLPAGFYARPVLEVAPALLGSVLEHAGVRVRLTEVEAYDGANDPASHAYRGSTARNAVMFGAPGHAYVYFSYGMHFCVNVVCGPVGTASAVLLRAGEVVAGLDVARARRPGAGDRDLARGPARLTLALAIDRAQNGVDVTCAGSELRLLRGSAPDPETVRSGPRVGIAAAADRPWRFWIDGERSVSAYRAHVPRRRPGAAAVVREDE